MNKQLSTNPGMLFGASRRLMFMVFAIAAAARVIFFALRGATLTPDSRSYLTLAHNLATYGTYSLDSGSPLSPSVRFPPLYPALLAVFDRFGASVSGISVAQAIIGAGSAVLVLFLARMVMSVRWAAVTALVFSLHPGAISLSSSLLAETLFTFLLLAGVCLLAAGLSRNRIWLTAASGILLGLAVLCRSVAVVLPLALVAVTFAVPGVASRFRHGLVLFACLALMITPWSWRSSRVAGHFVLVEDSGSAATLFYVATRLDWDQADEKTLWHRQASEVERLRMAALERGETDARNTPGSRLLIREGVRNIRANPMAYLASRARIFPYLFLTSYDSFSGINRSLGTLIAQRDFLRLMVKLCLLVVFSLIPFALAVIGLPRARANIAAALAATVWLYMLAVYFPLWLEPRYWMPAVPFLLVSAALGAQLVLRRGQTAASTR